MVRGSLFTALAVFLAAAAAPAGAETHQFSVNYLGGNAAELAPGSADPAGTMLAPGDSFVYELLAQPGMMWQANQTANVFAMFALSTNESAERMGSATLTLSLNGATVLSFADPAISQRLVHIGTNSIDLTAGLAFDRAVLSYALTSADEFVYDADIDDYLPTGNPSDTTVNRAALIFGYPDFHYSNSVSYVTAVPEPAAAALLLAGLLVVGLKRRSREPHAA